MNNKKLLESFYKLVGEYGYDNFGIEKLAQISGVDEEYIYNYFENKEKLLLEVINYIYLKEKILIFKLDETKNLKNELIEKGLMFIRLNKYDKHYSTFKNQILLVAVNNKTIQLHIKEIVNQYIQMFEEIIGKISCTFSEDIKREIAYQTFLILDSLVLYESYKENIDSETLWINYINRLFS